MSEVMRIIAVGCFFMGFASATEAAYGKAVYWVACGCYARLCAIDWDR